MNVEICCSSNVVYQIENRLSECDYRSWSIICCKGSIARGVPINVDICCSSTIVYQIKNRVNVLFGGSALLE